MWFVEALEVPFVVPFVTASVLPFMPSMADVVAPCFVQCIW